MSLSGTQDSLIDWSGAIPGSWEAMNAIAIDGENPPDPCIPSGIIFCAFFATCDPFRAMIKSLSKAQNAIRAS
jgi:hypothetical protein